MTKQKKFFIFLVFFVIPAALAKVEPLKVDFDARKDATAEGYLSWTPQDGQSKTFGEITVSFELLSAPDLINPRINWHNKDGLMGYKLAMDCLYAETGRGSESHPSFNGGTLELTINGLSEGRHTLTTCHNAPWPVSKYNRTISPCSIYVNDAKQAVVQPSQAITDDMEIPAAYLTFEAKTGKPVRIRIVPVGDPTGQLCTAVLNGFEIDNPAFGSRASRPIPADQDYHVFAHNDDPIPGSAGSGIVELNWTPSDQAVRQDIYFGTDRTAVENAAPSTKDIYKGRRIKTDSVWTAEGLDSMLTYYWRVDSVRADGSIIKGSVWSFRTRHLAFPGAEGYGRFARGGRGGRIVAVTTLEDYDPDAGEAAIEGSLRKAIEVEKGPRIIIFRVGGTILLKKNLTIPPDGGNVYVAGQTAPGEGICLARYSFGMYNTADSIIRFIRTRVGDYAKKPLDGMGMAGCDHCIIDHCSISWSLDEGHSSRGAKNITFSRNLISEALNHSYHYGRHSFAASISGGIGSYHHNLLAHCAGRNWSLAGGLLPDGNYAGYCDIRNNIVYNWRHRTTDGGVMRCNFVNNLYLPGPATTHFLLMRPDGDQMNTGNPQKFFLSGNQMEGYPQYNPDNWVAARPNYAKESEIRSDQPFFPSYVTTHSVERLYDNILTDVGANRPRQDAIDRRIIEEVKNRTFTYRGSKDNLPGIIDTQEDVGGYPMLQGGPAPKDSDGDGLPDDWEIKHGLNPNSPPGDFSDTHGDSDRDGFTNMDDYLEYLAGGDRFCEKEKIDRRALVNRHNVQIRNLHEFSPLSTGNGRFAFTADITGLQTFPQSYAKGIPLTTMAQWGWHSFPNTEGYKLEDTFVQIETYGRTAPYNSNQKGPAAEYLRANPHQITLGMIGLDLKKKDGTAANPQDIEDIDQQLILWEGLLISRFSFDRRPVTVQTCVHPQKDLVAVHIQSPLIAEGRLGVCLKFPYAAGVWGSDPADWTAPEKHGTQMETEGPGRFLFRRTLDQKRYSCAAAFSGDGQIRILAEHEYLWMPGAKETAFDCSVVFQETDSVTVSADFESVRRLNAEHWKTFWESGGAIDLSQSRDPRWKELERRIVLSQYLTAIQSAQKYPPQETGLTCNSWFGKFHLEMHWWHSVHFALWNRLEMMEPSLESYIQALPAAQQIARRQGYQGARWPKMTNPNAEDSPSGIGPLLIWQQPHPIYMAELVYRQKPQQDTLKKYQEIVFQTARFMADFAYLDIQKNRYVLGPPVIPAQENYKYADTWNPTYELCYWQWGLQTAQQWRTRLGFEPEEKWNHVINNLSPLPIRDGIYTAIQPRPFTNTTDHPSMLAALGVLPKTTLVDEQIMRRTAQWVYANWQWSDTWGWDYPMLAMTAARVGLPDLAIDALFIDSPKNLYWPNGHNYQRENLPLYLPGNGGLLTAAAMMAAGWDRGPERHAPGFPDNGLWVVRWENLRPMP